MTSKQEKLLKLFKEGVSVDVLWTLLRYKNKDAMLTDLRTARWEHFRKTGEK